MPHYVDPSAVAGQPLLLSAYADRDFNVLVAGMIAGRIFLQRRSFGRAVWFWTVTGPYLPEHLRPGNGEVETLDEAKAAFRAKFDKWFEWVNALQHQVVWNVGVGVGRNSSSGNCV